MNKNIRNLFKLVFSIVVIFIFINISIIPQSFAANNTPFNPKFATPVKLIISLAEILLTGFFVIKFTIVGIQFFFAASASDKVENKNKLYWTLIYGVLAFLAFFLFSYAVGL